MFFPGNEIRSLFLNFFAKRGHKILPSSSLLPQNDPTLLFTNAGMVQFKEIFLGEEIREYKRAATVQKCVRAGGKHNDLEIVGKTVRHHTFFEMLGNFSFGDYFKEAAIEFAWELLTETLKIPKESLWISVFEKDDEAYNIWKDKIGIPSKRIVRLGQKHNFWQMGETGPCGPCSEIIIDQGANYGCKKPECTVECDCGRFLELWNLVFMQFNRDRNGNTLPLPKPSIDTGMGLERIASVVQGVSSNFETDLIKPLVDATSEIAKKEYGKNYRDDISIRVIADHIRAISFLISDGILPSNEGQGYVLRRILRRSLRHGSLLGIKKPFLNKLVSILIEIMKEPYPELVEAKELITKLTLSEEQRFTNTLNYGVKILNELMLNLEEKNLKSIPGKEVFKLYDTYGFPVDLTQEIAFERGFTLDMEGFSSAMEEQKRIAKESWSGTRVKRIKPIYRQIISEIKPVEFIGHDVYISNSKILKIIKNDLLTDSLSKGEEGEIILEKTPFYGESGGQIGDTGKIISNGQIFEVMDTQKPLPELIVHKGKLITGTLRVGDNVESKINFQNRKQTQLNHTATHLLQAALREVLGDHVKQSGSLVEPKRLRFDFTHFSPLSKSELQRIERIVNEKIQENHKIEVLHMSFKDAIESGAIALFNEKYGDEVRVVKISDFSKELCGGSHIGSTGDIGVFKIIQERSIASGIRRIEAITGMTALEYIQKKESEIEEIANILKIKSDDIIPRIKKLSETIKEYEHQISKLKSTAIKDSVNDILSTRIKKVAGVKVVTSIEQAESIKELRDLADKLRERLESGIIVLGAEIKGKASILVLVSKDLTEKFHAGHIIKRISKLIGGEGGGRRDFAQAGGKNVKRLEEAINHTCKILSEEMVLH